MSIDRKQTLLDQQSMDHETIEPMEQESDMEKKVSGETREDLDSGTSREMEQVPNDDVQPRTNGRVKQKLSNDHISFEIEDESRRKSDEADAVSENTTVNGYLGYDVDGNVVLAEGDFVVGIEEVVEHVADNGAPSDINGGVGAAPDPNLQGTEEDGRVLAYIAADDLETLVGLAETEVSSEVLVEPNAGGVNGYGNHSDGLDEDEGEEDYEDGGYPPEEVGESLETAEAEEPLGAEEVAEVSDERNLGLKFPLTRVKRIMKADPDMQLVSQDAVFLITKATELFVEVVADAAYHHTLQAGRKTLLGRDLDACIDLIDSFAFLDGALEADH